MDGNVECRVQNRRGGAALSWSGRQCNVMHRTELEQCERAQWRREQVFGLVAERAAVAGDREQLEHGAERRLGGAAVAAVLSRERTAGVPPSATSVRRHRSREARSGPRARVVTTRDGPPTCASTPRL